MDHKMSQVDDSHEHASAPQAQHIHTDFALAFRDGRQGRDDRGTEYHIRVLHLGDLVVTTGEIVACDPFWIDTAPLPFTTRVPLGHHPIFIPSSSAWSRSPTTVCGSPARCCASHQGRWTDAFGDRLFEKLEATEDVWATVTAPNGGNLIAFDSGWGDGGYPSYFGYDAHDHLVCLVTDFYVLQGAT